MNYTWIIICFLKNYILFYHMITKMDDCEIKHQPNTKMFFLDRDNFIKDEKNQL